MILLRHGQSEFNLAFNATRVDPGIPDPRLTEEGKRQARAAALALAAHPVERLIASPYTRALETAEIVAGELGLPIEVHLLVREHCMFHCDIGSPRSTLAQRWRFHLLPGQQIVPQPMVTLRPKYGIKMRLESRQAAQVAPSAVSV